MEVLNLNIDGLKLITPKVYRDERGFFTERFNLGQFQAQGLPTNFIQDNFSRSSYGVLRGLHFQKNPDQAKLVTCLRGEIFDVAVDIREGSPTRGKYISVKLSGDEPQWFLIPGGFAHGFLVTSKEGADVMYKVDVPYSPKDEGAFHWSSPKLNIPWPLSQPLVSPKDDKAFLFE